MQALDRKVHWEKIYQTKALTDVSWYQPIPEISLELIQQTQIPTDGRILDVGAGDSFLVDHLLDRKFTNLSILDISEAAIHRAQVRLAEKASKVQWIVSDILDFQPNTLYDVWHDRAAFHFLTSVSDIQTYVQLAACSISTEGTLIIGTFSTEGPLKCSGIEIKQYNQEQMQKTFEPYFELQSCIYSNHLTPFQTVQAFIFCVFKRK